MKAETSARRRWRFSIALGAALSPSSRAANQYHKWYYSTGVWQRTTWMGVPVMKSVSDMWSYQEILHSLRPSLLLEFGTFYGGSAMFFASILRQLGAPFRVLSVDVDHSHVYDAVKQDSAIELLTASSSGEMAEQRIRRLKTEYPGPVFAILDSDHSKAHVMSELMALRPILSPGDYVIVEDSNINGHPVLPFWGPGPYEAVTEYIKTFPHDYTLDTARENKFGFTFAPHGFLIRR